jgi:antitoxin ParD1/3/4
MWKNMVLYERFERRTVLLSLLLQPENNKGVQTKMKLITLYLPETYIKLLDQLVAERFYPNRAEAIRVAVRQLLSEHGCFRLKEKTK